MSLSIQDWMKMIGQMVCCYYDHKDYEPQYGIMSRLDLYDKYMIVDYEEYHIDYCKPILRRLEDMTEEEERISRGIYVSSNSIRDWNILVDYLDLIGVDQRGWINQGLAIDAKTLEE